MNTYQEYFFLASLLLPIVFCPGPMTIFCMSNGINLGRRTSILAILGGSTAYGLQMLVTFVGIDLLETYPGCIVIIRMVGVFYLARLGLKYLFTNKVFTQASFPSSTQAKKKLFVSGFFVAISNPKSLLVYISIFPKFFHINQPVFIQYTKMGTMFLVLQFFSALTYTTLGENILKWTEKSSHQFIFRITVGCALLGASFLLFQI